jgi:hypothetical protein
LLPACSVTFSDSVLRLIDKRIALNGFIAM